uniref:Uncharacterized protein n=1 Tax=Tanacetum cinerariifolium TaxID=118510 RepID=A0A699JIF1_TANCI|nr:hypothetical protein [Tanacetum cinerariifolium]
MLISSVPLHEGWLIWSTVWSIVLGEREDDSCLVINLSGKTYAPVQFISNRQITFASVTSAASSNTFFQNRSAASPHMMMTSTSSSSSVRHCKRGMYVFAYFTSCFIQM